MSSILYGNFRLEVSGRVGSRVDRLAQQAPPNLQPRPGRAPESVPVFPAGRSEQLDVVRGAGQMQRPVGFFGPCGYGKTTLLRYIAASAVAEGLASPGVYLQAGPGGLRDLLHRLVRELYTTDQPVKFTPDECAQILSQVRALVVLDDVELTRGQADYLQSVLSGCTLLLGSPHPVLSHDDSHELAGLSNEAALQLVIGDLGRPLASGEMADVLRLIGAVDGQPLHLRQATALVREGRQSFGALARIAERDPAALDRLSVNALADRYRRTLAILALAAGALLPVDLVEVMGDIVEVGDCLRELRRRGLAEQRHDRFGLPLCQAVRYRQMLLNDMHHGAALRELTGWLTTRDPTSGESISAASAALSIVEWAADGRDWPGVVQLVRAAEPILSLAGHWEASRQALTHGLKAAVEAADHLSEALFAHQQGTLALCLDELTSAQQLLSHALRLREEHGDQDGAAVTRHNLQILQPPVPKPPEPRPRSWRRVLAVAGSSAIALLALTAGVVKALPGGPTPAPSPSITSPVTSSSSPISPSPSGGPTQNGTGPGNGGNPTGSQTPSGGTSSPPVKAKPPVVQPVSFGSVDITPGQSLPTAQAVTVSNPNAQSLAITGAQAGAGYTITADNCLATPIPPHNLCTISVQFAPATLGDDTQTLTVTSTAGTATGQLSGTGYAELTVTIAGKGSGSVTDSNGMNCTSGSCSEQITGPVTLTPTPGSTSYFANWGGTCQMSGNQVTSTADCTATADFEPNSVPIGAPQAPHNRWRPV